MRNVMLVLAVVAGCAAWMGVSAYLRDGQDSAAASSADDKLTRALDKADELGIGPFKPEPVDPAQPKPRAVVEQPKHDFGLMEPVTEGAHVFTIKNDGQAPLKLRQGPTTCKCTLSRLAADSVPPGQSAEIRLEWNTGAAQGLFQHSSTIWTNDPENAAIKLEVAGAVRCRFGADMTQVPFVGLDPGERRTVTVILYSQAWPEFEIASVDTPMAGLEHRIEPATTADLEHTRAIAGYRLHVTVPGDLPGGPFGDFLYVKARPKDGNEPAIELPLYVGGDVLTSISVVGDAVDSSRRVQLGTLKRDKGGQATLSMIVRSLDRPLQVHGIQVSPAYLEVRVEPAVTGAKATARTRLYRIQVLVPPGAPLGHHFGKSAGMFTLKVDHPNVSEVKLFVEFAVEE